MTVLQTTPRFVCGLCLTSLPLEQISLYRAAVIVSRGCISRQRKGTLYGDLGAVTPREQVDHE